MSTTFKVSSIANVVVTLDVSGEVSGAGTGSIKRKTTVDISSGVPTSATLEVTISAQGMDITATTNTTTTKI
ncbi:MAG: hypothetical protein ACI8QQ_003176 [Psychroserpens sp.]|jgi:hypothetical protein